MPDTSNIKNLSQSKYINNIFLGNPKVNMNRASNIKNTSKKAIQSRSYTPNQTNGPKSNSNALFKAVEKHLKNKIT